MPNDDVPARCPGCAGAIADGGIVAQGSRWHIECLTRATLEDALGVSGARVPGIPTRGASMDVRRSAPWTGAARDRDGIRLEHILQGVLAGLAITVFAGAAYVIIHIGGGAEQLGSRFFVAVAAVMILGAIDSQYGRLVRRLAPLQLDESPSERRYRIRSMLLLLGATAALATLAYRPDVTPILRAALPTGGARTLSGFTLPVVLSALAGVVVWFGLPRAIRYRRPGRWRAGVIATALGLVLLWLLPLCAVLAAGSHPLGTYLALLAIVVAGSVLGAGLGAMSKADNTPGDDRWDGMFP